MKKRRFLSVVCLLCCILTGMGMFSFFEGSQAQVAASQNRKNKSNKITGKKDNIKESRQIISQYLESEKGKVFLESEEQKQPLLMFQKKKTKIKAGSTYTYKVKKEHVQGKVTFQSSDEKIAVISSTGKLTAKQEGSVWVTASAQNCSAKIKVTVLPKKIIALDPGHSKNPARGTEPVGPGSSVRKLKDSGGTYGVATGVREYQLTLKLAKKLQKYLRQRGYKVVLTREDNQTSISNIERAQLANRENADIFVRIHADGSEVASVCGASAMYPTNRNPYVGVLSKKSRSLSDCILHAMCKSAKVRNRGSYGRDDLTGTNWASMPVTLVEVGFMTNPTEDRCLQDDDYQEQLVLGMADGIDDYFGY